MHGWRASAAHQAGDPIAQSYEVGLEAFGIAVEHCPQIIDRRTRFAGQDARGRHEMADVRILRSKLERLGVGVRGVGVTSKAGQGVAHQTERACVGHTGDAGVLGKAARADEVTPVSRCL